MSTIGGMTAAGLNLAGSIVGSARPEAASDQADAAAADHRSQIDRDATLKQASEDIADAEFSSDRDADGRQLYQRRAPGPPASVDAAIDDIVETSPPVACGHAADAFGDRGNALDLDA